MSNTKVFGNERYRLILVIPRYFAVNGFKDYVIENLPGTKSFYITRDEADQAVSRFYKRTGVKLEVQPYIPVHI